MMFSATSGYALRLLVCLAHLPEGTCLPGHELARRTQVPENYLAKLLLALGKAGIVTATRGSGGGYRLQPEALRVPLVTIVETFDGPRVRPSCLLGKEHPCSDENPCPAHYAWREIRESYLKFLETTKLADIAKYPLREFGTRAESLDHSIRGRSKGSLEHQSKRNSKTLRKTNG